MAISGDALLGLPRFTFVFTKVKYSCRVITVVIPASDGPVDKKWRPINGRDDGGGRSGRDGRQPRRTQLGGRTRRGGASSPCGGPRAPRKRSGGGPGRRGPPPRRA